MNPSSPEFIADRLASLEARVTASERRLRLTWATALLGLVLAFVLGGHKDAFAGKTEASFARLTVRVAAIERKTAPLSLLTDPNTKQATVRFSGVNVQIVSGTGDTEGKPNGRGNLIIGYNELNLDEENRQVVNGLRQFNARMGSHNLIVGSRNSYSSFGGFVAGTANRVTGKYASVSGGRDNRASGSGSSVGGGIYNTASGSFSHISGGQINKAIGQGSSVTGGGNNKADGFCSSATGGNMNTASGSFSSISGGGANNANGVTCSISGGGLNRVDGNGSSISGGAEQSVNGNFEWLAKSGGLSP